MIDLNRISIGIRAGIVAGIAAGLGARLSMRGVALVAGHEPAFTLGGTLAILIFGAIVGVPGGVLYATLLRWMPGSPIRKSLLFAGLLFLLLPVPGFLFARDGELALVTPVTGMALFSLPFLGYGLLLGPAEAWLERRASPAAPERPASLLGLILLGGFLFVGLFGLGSFGEFLSAPPAITRFLVEFGIRVRVFRTVNLTLMVLSALAYFTQTALIFWRGHAHRMGTFTGLALAFFAMVFFNNGRATSSIFGVSPQAGWPAGLAQAAALAALLLLFYLFPHGRFSPRWTRPVFGAWCAWLILWLVPLFPASALDSNRWPEVARFLITTAFLSSGVFAQLNQYRAADRTTRAQTRPVVAGMAVSVAAFLLIWLSAMLFPDLRASAPGLPGLIAFFPYLLPWLFIPLSIGYSMRRRGLWSNQANAVSASATSGEFAVAQA